MSISYRRYEILLPRRFNDGQVVSRRLITQTMIELRQHFGAASCETQTIRGQWEREEDIYQDELVRVFVDVEDIPPNRQFFQEFKGQLKKRFQQLDVWITSHPIDVI